MRNKKRIGPGRKASTAVVKATRLPETEYMAAVKVTRLPAREYVVAVKVTKGTAVVYDTSGIRPLRPAVKRGPGGGGF